MKTQLLNTYLFLLLVILFTGLVIAFEKSIRKYRWWSNWLPSISFAALISLITFILWLRARDLFFLYFGGLAIAVLSGFGLFMWFKNFPVANETTSLTQQAQSESPLGAAEFEYLKNLTEVYKHDDKALLKEARKHVNKMFAKELIRIILIVSIPIAIGLGVAKITSSLGFFVAGFMGILGIIFPSTINLHFSKKDGYMVNLIFNLIITLFWWKLAIDALL